MYYDSTSQLTDKQLLLVNAAAQCVGQWGYKDTSVDKITKAAGVAQGTFYLHYKSRQSILDEVLPFVGREMLSFIIKRTRHQVGFHSIEMAGFTAFFDYLDINPGFFRILNEAETLAPLGHQRHLQLTTSRYSLFIRNSILRGDIYGYHVEEATTVAYMLQAVRSYLYLGFVKRGPSHVLPKEVIMTYRKFLFFAFPNTIGESNNESSRGTITS